MALSSKTSQITKNISDLLQPIEDTICNKVLPAITGKRPISDAARKLFTLPVNLGGLGIPILSHVADHELPNSVAVTEHLVKSILKQTVENTVEIKAQQKVTRRCVREENRRIKEEQMTATLDSLTSNTYKALFWHKRIKGTGFYLAWKRPNERAWICVT